MKLISKLILTLLVFAVTLHCPALAVRTDITAIVPKNPNAGTIAANGADISLTAADVSNKNSCTLTGREMLFAFNSDDDTAYTVTVSSVADQLGRTGDVESYSIGFGEYALIGPFPLEGWKQSTGKLHFEANNAAIKFAVIRVPFNN
jgi:hypothetical protein